MERKKKQTLIERAQLEVPEFKTMYRKLERKVKLSGLSSYKDGFVPLSKLIVRGLDKYLEAVQPKKWLFNGRESGSPISSRGTMGYARSCQKGRNWEMDNNFKYKDYRQAGKVKIMALSKREFIRRFSLHILPLRFVRIRHFGLLHPRNKEELKMIRD